MRNIWDRLVAKLSSRLRKTTTPGRVEWADELVARVESYEAEMRGLRDEIDELRQDGLRIAELYDLVFERLKQDRS